MLENMGSRARRFRTALHRRANESLLKINLMRTGRRLREPTGKVATLLRKAASLVPNTLLANMTGSYEALLHSSFMPFLDGLGPQDRYLDIGPGRARAGREHASGPDAHRRAAYVGLAISKPRFSRRRIAAMERKLGSHRWRYVEGKRFQDYTPEELGGKASFMAISDVYASTHYWSDIGELKRVFELAGQLLKPGGRFYTTLHAEPYRHWVEKMSGLRLLKVKGRLVLERTERLLHVGDPPPRSQSTGLRRQDG